MTQTINQLTQQFSIDGVARFESGEGGLTRLMITSDLAEAELYLHGGHVTHFQPRGAAPVLWMSAASRFEAGQAIRGGVPVIFPWFGAHPTDSEAPSHGLVRTAEWSVNNVQCREDGRVCVELAHAAKSLDVVYRVVVGKQLELEMVVANQSEHAAKFEQALHTYLNVADVREISVHGLAGATYIDKVDGFQRKVQPDAPIQFAGETDSVYLDTDAVVRIEDPGLERTIAVHKTNSQSTVVWNPWIDKAKRMSDFGDDEWPGMVCVESANVADNAVSLEADQVASMSTTIEVA